MFWLYTHILNYGGLIVKRLLISWWLKTRCVLEGISQLSKDKFAHFHKQAVHNRYAKSARAFKENVKRICATRCCITSTFRRTKARYSELSPTHPPTHPRVYFLFVERWRRFALAANSLKHAYAYALFSGYLSSVAAVSSLSFCHRRQILGYACTSNGGACLCLQMGSIRAHFLAAASIIFKGQME